MSFIEDVDLQFKAKFEKCCVCHSSALLMNIREQKQIPQNYQN